MTVSAQETLIVGQSQVITLSGEEPAVFTYDSPGDEVLTVTVRGLSVPQGDETDIIRDTVVAVLNPDGKQIAYNNDHHTQNPDLLPTDSVIPKLKISQAGMYTIHVNTYGGIFQSEVEIILTQADLFETTLTQEANQTVITGVLPYDGRYEYVFEASGEVTLTARDIGNTLDPRLLLLDADGVVVASNDDHGTGNPALDLFDAQITMTLSGTYTLVLVDFLGRPGTFEVTITR